MPLLELGEKAKPAEFTIKDVDVEGEILQFRSPDGTDYYPSDQRIERLRRDFPKLRGIQLTLVLLLGGCYLQAEAEQGKVSSDAIFAQIACNDFRLWSVLVAKWREQFPGALFEEVEVTEDDVPFETNNAS